MDGAAHKLRVIEAAEEMFRKDVQTNRDIGKHGADFILRGKQSGEKVDPIHCCSCQSKLDSL